MNRLKGKYILITGASQGLGRQLAIDFAREGAAGIAIVARRADALERVAASIHEAEPKAEVLTITADLSSEGEIERVVATSIGPTPLPYLLDYPLEDFRQVLETNLTAPFLLIKKALPAMIENGGSIINVTSDAGRVGYPGWGAYGISKFGIEGMSATWAAELEGSRVRVNWVDPGNMNTEMHRAAEPEEDPTEWADPAAVTEVFIYLASEESKNINGQRFEAQEENWGRKAEAAHSE